MKPNIYLWLRYNPTSVCAMCRILCFFSLNCKVWHTITGPKLHYFVTSWASSWGSLSIPLVWICAENAQLVIGSQVVFFFFPVLLAYCCGPKWLRRNLPNTQLAA